MSQSCSVAKIHVSHAGESEKNNSREVKQKIELEHPRPKPWLSLKSKVCPPSGGW